MLPFFLIFEGRRPQARELVLIAVLVALNVAGRAAFFMLPEFKPVVAMTILAGVAFGGETGFLVGAMTMLVSNMLFSQGPWTPWQMFAMGIIGWLAGILYRKGVLRRSKLSLCIFGVIASTVVFGGIMNPASALMWSNTINWKIIMSYYITGIPVDLVRAVATFVFLWLGAEPMLEKLDRIKVKYGLVDVYKRQMLYWASHLGNGWDTGAVSSPILVDDCLVVYANNKIYRVSKATGEVETEGDMAGTSSFAINGPTYANGILLVGLSNGRIQAFNAKTLESLWIYKDPVGDQPNCPITILNGYAYTGFWNGESKDSSFVCISLTDEDPENEMEEKAATWRMVQNGGFYWAGAYACDDFVIVGTDDGEAQCSYLYLLDPLTGKVLDFKSGFDGDIRSTICYDSVTKAYYFTSKGGTFYRAKVEAQNGSYAITACDGLKLDNGSDDPALPPMSTSTPVVYNGRAYIGVSGTGQFTQYSGHNITVIDLENWKIAYSVKTQGYPQTSGLLTTAYEENNGYVYVYFFDNYTPYLLYTSRCV